jgi:hypothetical protein
MQAAAHTLGNALTRSVERAPLIVVPLRSAAGAAATRERRARRVVVVRERQVPSWKLHADFGRCTMERKFQNVSQHLRLGAREVALVKSPELGPDVP